MTFAYRAFQLAITEARRRDCPRLLLLSMDGFNLILMRLTTAIIVSASLWSSANAQSSPEITFNDGRLSVNANNVSVAQLADALSQETGIAIVIQGDTNAAMSADINDCLLYTSPSPRDATLSRMPSSA